MKKQRALRFRIELAGSPMMTDSMPVSFWESSSHFTRLHWVRPKTVVDPKLTAIKVQIFRPIVYCQQQFLLIVIVFVPNVRVNTKYRYSQVDNKASITPIMTTIALNGTLQLCKTRVPAVVKIHTWVRTRCASMSFHYFETYAKNAHVVYVNFILQYVRLNSDIR